MRGMEILTYQNFTEQDINDYLLLFLNYCVIYSKYS